MSEDDDEVCTTCGGEYGDGPRKEYSYCPECDMYWGVDDD